MTTDLDALLAQHPAQPESAVTLVRSEPRHDGSTILAIDPGYAQSAWLGLAKGHPLGHSIDPNATLLASLRLGGFAVDAVVIEQVESFGMSVGKEVFETVWWSGQFAEAAHPLRVERVTRRAVKLHLCGSNRAKDSNIRQALLDRYGGRSAVGVKARPGPLYGVTRDVWSALAVAVTFADGMTL